MINEQKTSLVLTKPMAFGDGTIAKRFSQNVRCFFTRNKHRYQEVFANLVIEQLAQNKNVCIVASKSQLSTVATTLKEHKLFSHIDEKTLTVHSHNLNSKTGFYFQKDFVSLLAPLSKSLKNRDHKVIFFDSDALLHCELAEAERRQVRDFLIVAERVDLKIDLLSSQTIL